MGIIWSTVWHTSSVKPHRLPLLSVSLPPPLPRLQLTVWHIHHFVLLYAQKSWCLSTKWCSAFSFGVGGGGGALIKSNREDSLPFTVLNGTHVNTELFVSFMQTQSLCGNSHLAVKIDLSHGNLRIFQSIHTCDDQRSIVFYKSLNLHTFFFFYPYKSNISGLKLPFVQPSTNVITRTHNSKISNFGSWTGCGGQVRAQYSGPHWVPVTEICEEGW